VIDVAAQYGSITFASLVDATRDGIAALASHDSVTLRLAAGTYAIDMTGDLFAVDGVEARGEFAVEGAGMGATTLLLEQRMNNVIKGSHFRNLAWRDLAFSHTRGQTTKGMVFSTTASSLTLQVPGGFPTPRDILDFRYPRLRPTQGLYMLQYRTSAPGSALVPAKRTDFHAHNFTARGALPAFNAHLPYECSSSGGDPPVNGSAYVCDLVEDLGAGRWRFAVKWGALRPLYEAAVGSASVVVGVKAKRLGQAYALSSGDGLKFERVRWQGHSRGIISDCSNVLFNGTDVSPMPPPVPGSGYATATSGGGPQIKDSSNVVVVGHTSQSSGDDSLAFFNIASGRVSACEINDGWGAGMLLSNASGVPSGAFDVSGNTVRRSPIYYPLAFHKR